MFLICGKKNPCLSVHPRLNGRAGGAKNKLESLLVVKPLVPSFRAERSEAEKSIEMDIFPSAPLGTHCENKSLSKVLRRLNNLF